ncbi:hypothetical protein MRX96_022568 [Rhipicephalus microplus]
MVKFDRPWSSGHGRSSSLPFLRLQFFIAANAATPMLSSVLSLYGRARPAACPDRHTSFHPTPPFVTRVTTHTRAVHRASTRSIIRTAVNVRGTLTRVAVCVCPAWAAAEPIGNPERSVPYVTPSERHASRHFRLFFFTPLAWLRACQNWVKALSLRHTRHWLAEHRDSATAYRDVVRPHLSPPLSAPRRRTEHAPVRHFSPNAKGPSVQTLQKVVPYGSHA